MRRFSTNTYIVVLITLLVVLTGAVGGWSLHTVAAQANQVNEIKNKIENRSQQIQQLQEDIARYEKELHQVEQKKSELTSKVNKLRSSENKIETDIKLTQQQIQSIEIELKKINLEIEEQKLRIEKNHDALSEALRTVDELDASTLVEKFLSYDNLGEAWAAMDTLQTFQRGIKKDLDEVRALRDQTEQARSNQQKKKKELLALRQKFADQRQIVVQRKAEQNAILASTRRKESNYESILAEKRRQKEKFLSELNDLESQLQVVVNPATIPETGPGTFRWPVNQIKITQQFGGSAFAKQNPHVYGRPYHNGTDFGVPTGSPVSAVRQGTVIDTGNTDKVSGCYSYGKWVLIEHDNGLSTLYAHLSLIKVRPGQQVGAGEVIAYSGNTGYSTGPHLHLTTYASDAVRVVRFGDYKRITNCGAAHIPVAPKDGYLDPMQYLP